MKTNEKTDIIHVLNKRVQLRQIPEGFRTSMDSVMLAAACPVKSGQSVLDLGCGVGSVGLCILERVPDVNLTGIDIQQDHVEESWKNAALNGMESQAEFECADIRTLEMESFDHVVCNPPYFEAGAHIPSPSDSRAKAIGHLEQDLDLRDWVDCAFRHIKGQGSLTVIHTAGALDDILHSLYGSTGGKRFGAIEVFPLWPREGAAAKRVIVRAWKHKKTPATILPGLTLHTPEGQYTQAADTVLRDAQVLF